MAILLRRYRLVETEHLRWIEVAKASVTAVVSGILGAACVRYLLVGGTRKGDVEALALLTLTWAAAVALGLSITRSQLPALLRRRKPALSPPTASGSAG
jgi:hypothetical protein